MKLEKALFPKALFTLVIVSFLVAPFSFVTEEGFFKAKTNTVEAGWLVEDLIDLPYDIFTALETALTAANTYAVWVKEYVLDFAVWWAMKIIIRSITQDIVAYINSGFKSFGHNGNSGFLRNPGQFFKQIADEAAGTFIFNELGDLGKILCSPFSVQIRTALYFRFGLGGGQYSDKAQCTLSQVFGNVQGAADDFLAGDFAKGGWDGWFSVTQDPNNNMYGAYFQAETEIALRSEALRNTQSKELDWGKGMLSFKKCVTHTNPDGTEYCTMEVVTPGNLIEDQLATTFGSPIRQLELADEFNEIISALVRQFLGGIFGENGGGLTGAGDDPYFTDDPDFVTPEPPVPDEMPKSCKPGDELNIALKKSAQQMAGTFNGGGGPNAALDGSPPAPYGSSEAQTTIVKGVNPWWQVDLGASRDITKVRIFHRRDDRDEDKLDNIYVFLSDTPYAATDTDPEVLKNKAGVSSKLTVIDASDPIEVTGFAPASKGRYLRVQRTTAGADMWMQLAEVQAMVIATIEDCPPPPTNPPIPNPNPIPSPSPLPNPDPTPVPPNAIPVRPGDNLQAKIDSCPSGGSLLFTAGTYNLSSTLNLKSNCSYFSTGASLVGDASITNIMRMSAVTNIRVQGFEFLGNARGIALANSPSNFIIVNNTFRNKRDSISTGNGMSNAQISKNVFRDKDTSWAISGGVGTFRNVKVNENLFQNVGEAIRWDCGAKIESDPNSSVNMEIRGNIIEGVIRHAIELREGCHRLIVSDNVIGKWRNVWWSDDGSPPNGPCPGGAHMAISLATGYYAGQPPESSGTDILVSNNKLDGVGKDGVNGSTRTCFSAIEAMGDRFNIHGNTLSDWGWLILQRAPSEPAGLRAHDFSGNRICNSHEYRSELGTYEAASCL